MIVYGTNIVCRSAIAPELNGGRFGDNIVSVSHALWLAYLYNLDLKCPPFEYSQQLTLHDLCDSYTMAGFNEIIRCQLTTHVLATVQGAKDNSFITIPYFPEYAAEYATKDGYGYIHAPLFVINWNDQAFLDRLRYLCSPKNPIEFPAKLPEDRACVALHIRFGGGYDLPRADGKSENFFALDRIFPLKSPPLRFYIAQLIALHDELNKVPLYVFVFTDEPNPELLVEKILPHIAGRDIVFDYRRAGNAHNQNVVEDFVFMQKFPYMIRPQSNISYMASRLSSTRLLTIDPHAFVWDGKWLIITHARTIFKDGRELIRPCSCEVYR